jgi:hypothetical protein
MCTKLATIVAQALGIAAAAEGWPVLGDWSVIVDSAALGEQVDGSGDHAFATREAHEERVSIDWSLGAGVGQARSGVEDQVSIEVSGNLGAAFDQVVEHNLHRGNHGGRGLQVDTTARTTKRARRLVVGKPSQLVVAEPKTARDVCRQFFSLLE